MSSGFSAVRPKSTVSVPSTPLSVGSTVPSPYSSVVESVPFVTVPAPESAVNETTLEGATIAGAGVVTNGTLSAATIAYDEDALPTFTDVTFDGTLTVDFDKTDEDPLDKTAAKAGIVVARYTGEAPANLRVKSVNTGIERVRTAVVCEGGDVIAKMTQSGFSVIIR